jgi:hypothetical protein
MSVTFNTPVRIYKYNNPTNNGVIAPDNTGAAQVTQEASLVTAVSAVTSGAVVLPTAPVGTTTPQPVTIPAGSIIAGVYFYETTAPSALTGGVITVDISVVNPTTGAVTTTALGTITPTTTGGLIPVSFTATAATAALLANVGPLDVTISFSQATISAITGSLNGTFQVEYTARNFTGSIINVGQGYTNS